MMLTKGLNQRVSHRAVRALDVVMVRSWFFLAGTLLLALPSVAVAQEGIQGEVRVVAIQSGNTIDVETADGSTYRVRMLGVNAPRIAVPESGDECYGPEAAAFLHDLVDGQMVWLEQEVTDTDASGRLLRHVWAQDRETGIDVPLSITLIFHGYAEAQAIPPDTMMSEYLSAVEADARSRGAGMWSAC